MKITSRLVSGAVALAMAGAMPAWADAASPGNQAAPDSAAPAARAGGHSSQASYRSRGKNAPLHLASAGASPAANPQQPAVLQEVVVTGIRQSMESALSIERFSNTIEDSIVASDIGKLPDVTAIEAMQRIPGIQISRSLGQGGGTVNIGGSAVDSGYEIRGLPYAETTLNGDEVFSATGSRVLNLEDVPSALLSGINVYKDPTASLIAGGLAGTVDLRTHKPFDFSGPQLDLSAGETYGDMVGTAKPNFNVLGSNLWNTGIGKVGALLDISYDDRPYREDGITNSALATSTTAVPGKTIEFTNGVYNTMFVGDQKRTGVDAVLQWQPADDFETYLEGTSEDFRWQQNQYSFYTQAVDSQAASYGLVNQIQPGSVTLFPGTSDVESATYDNALASSVGAWRTVEDNSRQLHLHATWRPAPWIVTGDLNYTKATERLNNPAVDIGAIVPQLTQSNSLSGITTSSVAGMDPTDLAAYAGTASNYASYLYDTEQHFRGGETAAALNVTYELASGFLSSVEGGVRWANREDAFNTWSNFGAIDTADIQGNASWFNTVPLSPFFSAASSTAVDPPYTVFNPGLLHYDPSAVYQAFGVAPPADSGASDYHIDERTYAGFLQLNFSQDLGSVPMSGNLGVRLVRHEDFLDGELQTNGVASPSVFASGETNPLPSLNLLFKLTQNLQLRLAANKTIAYPDFSQLSPSISLLPAQGAASGGNPYLKPTTASQVDGSLAYYFTQGSVVSADVFYKRLQNFWLSETQQDALTVGGVKYNLTAAVDGGSATIKGVEFNYQQFFRNLPGWLSGLGFDANYTYIEAAAPTSVVGQTTTVPGLSNHSYNLIGMYQQGPVSFRIAYNWRSAFYSSLYTGSNAQLSANPIYTGAYGWLDASLEYNITPKLQVYADGENLLRTTQTAYYGVPTLPEAATIDDREVMVGVNWKLF